MPLFIVSFLLLTALTYDMASDALMDDEIKLSKSIAGEMALRIQLSVTNVQLPLKMAAGKSAFMSGDDEMILPVLLQLRELHPIITQTFFIHPDGMMLRADGKILDRHTREYYKKVVATHEPYISKPFMGETTQKMQTMVLQPMIVDDELKGILMASVYVDNLAHMTADSELHPSGVSYIIDESGAVIGCDKPSPFVGKMSLADTEEAPSPVDAALVAAWKQAVETDEEIVVYYRSADESMRFAAITSFELAGNKWSIISTASAREVTEPVRRLMIIVSFMFLVVLAIAVFVIIHFAESISKPLANIAGAFEELEEADNAASDDDAADKTETKREDAWRDEIGILASSVERMRILNDQKQHYQQQASSDELTGLLNRFGFKRRVEKMMAEHAGSYAMFIFADLDHLKHINDGIGHSAGDDAIVTASDILKRAAGPNALIGRLGGDEFIIFKCIDEGAEGASEIADHIKELAKTYNASSGKPYYVELSLGIIEFQCSEEMSMNSVLQQADMLLYEAKKHRRATALIGRDP